MKSLFLWAAAMNCKGIPEKEFPGEVVHEGDRAPGPVVFYGDFCYNEDIGKQHRRMKEKRMQQQGVLF